MNFKAKGKVGYFKNPHPRLPPFISAQPRWTMLDRSDHLHPTIRRVNYTTLLETSVRERKFVSASIGATPVARLSNVLIQMEISNKKCCANLIF
jgi:hypothetical protein